jgi:DNA primase
MNNRFLEDLKNRTDIVEIVKRYASDLKKSGKNYMCRSPFRNERTPSFCVSPDKQFWYDFGTSEGGDVISFLEKIENLSFSESIEMLADIAGVEIPKDFGNDRGPTKEEKKDIFSLHEKSCEYFEIQLQQSEIAREYLKKRNITKKMITEWRFGYGGDEGNGLTKFLLNSGFTETDITRSGVAFERSFGDKQMKDRFGKRLMIPIFDHRDSTKIIAFTGRDLSGKKDIAKYINSPENPVYHKSSTLFGFDRARKALRESKRVILVEGNFDVISSHDAGFLETVATCGTSLTEEHLRILKRLTKNVYLAFDSDLAGKRATLRAVEMTLTMEMNPFIIDISEGKDFDDLVQKDKKILEKTISGAQNAVQFLLQKFGEKYLDQTIEGEKNFLDAIFYFIKLLHRPVERDEFLTKISKKLNRSKSIIEEEFAKFIRKSRTYEKIQQEGLSPKKCTKGEFLVGIVSAYETMLSDVSSIIDTLLEILNEKERTILEKKIQKEPLSDQENTELRSWEMYTENLYTDQISEDILKKDITTLIHQIQNERAKINRQQQAQKLGEEMIS